MNPIQTRYAGYLFRSRLEARFAVFFEKLGVNYEYEKEGFELDMMTRYLPDFWIPEWQCFIEIKPKTENEREKYQALLIQDLWHEQKPEYPLWVVVGTPYLNDYEIWRHPRDMGAELFAECRCCSGVYIEACNGDSWGPIGAHAKKCLDDNDHHGLIGGARMMEAYNAARGARFEHGV